MVALECQLYLVALEPRLSDLFYLDSYEIFVVRGGYIENLEFDIL